MVDTRGPQDGDADNLSARLASSLGRTAPRSPREALRPESIPPPPERSRAVRHPLVVILNFGITTAIVGAVLIGGAVLAARFQFDQPATTDERLVTVPVGTSADEIADILQREGIGNRWVFLAGLRLNGAEGKLKAGFYRIPANSTLNDVMREMIEGRVADGKITIPEGFTSRQIADCLSGDTVFVNGYTSGLSTGQIQDCTAGARDLTGTIAQVPAEGALLPETYKFSSGDTRQSVIDRMQRDQARIVADIWSRRAPDLPLKTPDQLVTLASIIEKETSLSDERSRVAAVYVNRLRINMALQADPTVIYALFKGAKPAGYKPTKADLQVKSDYNTYMVNGLPPGPIANPGRAALEAAANPSRTRDLYFVADGSGGHVFAETYEDHLRNVARYRAGADAAVAAPAPAVTPASVTPVPAVTPGPGAAPTAPPKPAGSPPAPQARPGTPAKP